MLLVGVARGGPTTEAASALAISPDLCNRGLKIDRSISQSGTRPTDAELARALKRSFGYTRFRLKQREIIRAILERRAVFAALPTGGGKSLCYQIPAVVREGFTLVVSPLISLMKDQVDGAREDGIPAAFLNSSLGGEEARTTWLDLAAGSIRLLYASPERLSLPAFWAALARFGLAFVAVDEAHCISEWGHEFRPGYRSLGILRQEFPTVAVASFTATATRVVHDDMVRLLGFRSPFIVRASFDRPELFYRVAPKVGGADEQVLDFISRHPDQSGIVYRGTRKAVERTAAFLTAQRIRAVAYHAGLETKNGERGRRPSSGTRSRWWWPRSPSAWGSTSPTSAGSYTPTCRAAS
jgi:ATP-dependent DNA helicase RecQ